MGKKTLDVTSIANELQEASVFFQKSAESLPSPDKPGDHTDAESRDKAGIDKLSQSDVTSFNDTALLKQSRTKKPPSPPSVSSPVAEELNKSEGLAAPDDTSSEKSTSVLSSEQAGMLASNHDSVLANVRETIRSIGKEVSYTRLTQEEKRRIMETIYSFRSTSNIKTSENELMRIAINFLLEDYDLHKEESALHKILHP